MAFHEKFLPVLVMSKIQKDKIIESVYVEREVIENADDDLQDLMKNIFNGKNVKTDQFVKRWSVEEIEPSQLR